MQEFYELTRDETRHAAAWNKINDHCFAHYHSTLELTYVESGVLCAIQDGAVSMVEAGHLIVNSSYILHSYSTPEASRVIVATIPLSAVPSLRAQLTQHRFSRGIVDAHGLKECRSILRMMADPAHAENERFVNSLGEAVLALLIEKIGLKENVADAQTDLMMRVLSYLQQNMHEGIDVNTVATHFGYSAGRFSHIFNHSIGCSFTRYVSNLRCLMAQQLLNAGELPLIDVASTCGFASLRTFHRVYKAYVGRTPRGIERA